MHWPFDLQDVDPLLSTFFVFILFISVDFRSYYFFFYRTCLRSINLSRQLCRPSLAFHAVANRQFEHYFWSNFAYFLVNFFLVRVSNWTFWNFPAMAFDFTYLLVLARALLTTATICHFALCQTVYVRFQERECTYVFTCFVFVVIWTSFRFFRLGSAWMIGWVWSDFGFRDRESF